MIRPYSEIIQFHMTKIKRLGFKLISDSDYEIIFGKGNYELIFSTERYYHPSFSTSLVYAPMGEIDGGFELSFLMEIIDPDKWAKVKEIGLASYDALKEGLAIDLDFIYDYRAILFKFPLDPPYRELYEKKRKEFLSEFGVGDHG